MLHRAPEADVLLPGESLELIQRYVVYEKPLLSRESLGKLGNLVSVGVTVLPRLPAVGQRDYLGAFRRPAIGPGLDLQTLTNRKSGGDIYGGQDFLGCPQWMQRI